MDTFSLVPNEARPSKRAFLLEPPTWNQEDTYQYAHCSHQNCGSTLTESRNFMADMILSRKRPIRSLVTGYVQKAPALDARSPSPSRPSKRTKEPTAALSPPPQHSRAHERANDTQRPLLQLSRSAKACAAEQDQQASLDYQSKSAGLRRLSSPIILRGSLESFEDPKQDFMGYSTLADQSKCLYYLPTNPSEEAHRCFRAHDGGPYRRLSYGTPPSTPEPRVFHKVTDYPRPGEKASLHVKENGCLRSYNQSPEAIQAKSGDSESSQNKPRLWIDPAEDEEIHGMRTTTVTSSSSKPREILLSARNVTIKPAQTEPAVCPDCESSTIVPGTASESAVGLGIEGFEGQKQEKRQQAFQRIKARNIWDTMTPNSATTVQYTTPLHKPCNPNPPPTDLPPLSESTIQILFDLDTILTGNASLHLYSPVIQNIRLASTHTKPQTPPTIPLSRFSTFKPPPRPLLFQTPITPPNSTSSAAHISTATSYSKPNPTLQTLRTIFPNATTYLLSVLYAAYLAFHYIHNIPLPPQDHYPEEYNIDISYILSKARAMLGLQMPGRKPSLPSCWVRPCVEGVGWRERIEKVKCGLRKELGRVLRECVGFDLGILVEEVMVRAVGEVVRLVEQREAGK